MRSSDPIPLPTGSVRDLAGRIAVLEHQVDALKRERDHALEENAHLHRQHAIAMHLVEATANRAVEFKVTAGMLLQVTTKEQLKDLADQVGRRVVPMLVEWGDRWEDLQRRCFVALHELRQRLGPWEVHEVFMRPGLEGLSTFEGWGVYGRMQVRANRGVNWSSLADGLPPVAPHKERSKLSVSAPVLVVDGLPPARGDGAMWPVVCVLEVLEGGRILWREADGSSHDRDAFTHWAPILPPEPRLQPGCTAAMPRLQPGSRVGSAEP